MLMTNYSLSPNSFLFKLFSGGSFMSRSFRLTSVLVILIAFIFSMNILAQKTEHSVGLDPKVVSGPKLGLTSPIEAPNTGYGADGVGNNWYSAAIPVGTLSLVGPTGGTLHQGGDFDGNGIFYAVRSPATLMTVNVTTGAETVLGTITGVTSGQTITSLAWNPSNSTMYLGSTNITSSELYTFNSSTYVATLVGTVTNCAGLIAVGINCDGAAYGVDIVGDQLLSINTSTGAGTVLGPLGFDANYAQDADFDNATGTLYIAAYNNAVGAGELRTADLTTGATTLVTSWGAVEITSFGIDNTCGPPCPVGSATNPNPPSGTTGVSITSPGNATWTNGAGTTNVEVFFGPVGNVVSVYSGAAITSLAIPGPLAYDTDYEWRVVCKNDTCTGGPVATWSFTTELDPGLTTLFVDDFEAGSGLWTITNDGGTVIWQVFNPPYPNTYTLPVTATGGVFAADVDQAGTGSTCLSTATLTNPIDASLYGVVNLEFDNDWQALGATDFGYVEVSVDGGTTWTAVRTFDVTDVRNTHEVVNISSFVALQSFRLRLRSVQPAWDWWWVVDNVKVIGSGITPVELLSFAANVNETDVTLNWSTATETNNSGFQVERSNGTAYEVVGFVAGHGTTTEVQNYSFVDQNLASGNYTYRLKQVDFNGTFEYSNTIEAEILVKDFSLGQNYPNPFNPSTTINFSLAVDSKVSLKIFDVLGQEVATLVNGQLAAGSQKVSFNASSLNSGVYFYRIDADGIDGQKFSSVKKMILTK